MLFSILQKHWWAVLLMGVALVICMALFIQICAVHTPSSNPKKAPARKLTLKRQPRPRQQVNFCNIFIYFFLKEDLLTYKNQQKYGT